MLTDLLTAEVEHARQLLGQQCEFVVMRGEECARADLGMKIFDRGTRPARGRQRSRSAAHLVEKHEGLAVRC